MDIERIRPLQDNVLLQFRAHANRNVDEQLPSGLFIPRTAQAPSGNQAIEATVIAAGPGRYLDKWLDHEQGTDSVGSPVFIAMNPAIRPGVRVLLSAAALGADRLFADDRAEYRMVRESCIEAVLDGN